MTSLPVATQPLAIGHYWEAILACGSVRSHFSGTLGLAKKKEEKKERLEPFADFDVFERVTPPPNKIGLSIANHFFGS